MSLSDCNKSNILRLYPSSSDLCCPSLPYPIISFLHLNIRSILNKIDYIASSNLTSFDVLLFSESWLTEDIPNNLIHLDGYNIFRKDRPAGNHGRGLIFYVKTSLTASPLPMPDIPESESLWLKINSNSHSHSLIIGGFYRYPNGSVKNFCDSFIDTLDVLPPNNLISCLGDFNINLLEESYSSNYFRNTMNVLQLKVLNNLPTRITDTSESLIDLIITNKPMTFFLIQLLIMKI